MSTSCNHTSMMLPISLLYLLTSLWSTSSDSILAQNGVQLRMQTMDSMDCVRNSDVSTCKFKQDGQQNAILSRMKRTLSIICHCSKLNCQKLSQHHTPAINAHYSLQASSLCLSAMQDLHAWLAEDPHAQARSTLMQQNHSCISVAATLA